MGEETELSKSFKEAVARWLQARGVDAVTITSWDEYIDTYGGGCPSCGPETDVEVWINYLDSAGVRGNYRHDGKFSYLLEDILNA